MPKETILSELMFGEGSEAVGIEVHWGREASYVQIATTLIEQSTHERLTREVEGGWFANLDRLKVNDLIRKLRRARDQAFGADE